MNNKIKNMDSISVCDKTDVWAMGVLFLDMVSKNRLSNTFRMKHISFLSQDIAAGKMVGEFAALQQMERDKLFELLGIAHLWADDVQKEEKLADLYTLIKRMVERKPAQRASAVELLRLKCFAEPPMKVEK